MEVKALQQMLAQFRQVQEKLEKRWTGFPSKHRPAVAWSA